MHTITQSVFLQSLGYAIANSLWQAAFLWLLVMGIHYIFKLSSSSKYYTAVAAQVTAFVWFVSTLQYYYGKLSEVLQASFAAAPDNSYIAEPAVNNISSAVLYVFIKTELLLPYLSLAYLVILLLLAVRFMRAFQYTRHLKTGGLHKASLDIRLFVKEHASILSLKREIKIYLSEFVKSPVTTGFLKPVILLPLASVNNLTSEQMEAVLLHELAHIKRADYLLNIILGAIETILFFNPFNILISKIIKAERENSCDDYVLQFQYNPAVYAQALLQVAYIQAKPSFTMQAARNNKGELLQRVKRMLQKEERNYQFRNRVAAMALLTFLLTTFAWMQPVVESNNKATHKKDSSQRLFVEPFTATLNNPLFNPVYFFTRPLSEDVNKSYNKAQNESSLVAGNSLPLELHSIVAPVFSDIMDKELAAAKADAETALEDVQLSLDKVLAEGLSDSSLVNEALQQNVAAALSKVNFDDVKESVNNLAGGLKNIFDGDALTGNLQKVIDAWQQKAQANEEAATQNQKWMQQYTEAQKKVKGKIRAQQDALQKLQLSKEKPGKQNISLAALTDDNLSEVLKNYIIQNYLSALDSLRNATFVLPASIAAENISSEDVPGSEAAPAAGFIVLQHHPENETSHKKIITVHVIGTDGTEHTLEFSVEVYQ